MNFYILTFKYKVWLSFVLVLFNLLLIDLSLYIVADMKTTKTAYISDKFSKMKHFKLNNKEVKDIIFLGSSRTFYHISTNIFKNRGIEIYNFGISGSPLEDYPSIIPSILEAKPRNVVISLPIERLYQELLIAQFPTIEEMKYYYEIDKEYFFRALKKWIVNQHQFLQYSEVIFYKIVSIYKKFTFRIGNDSNKKVNIENQSVDLIYDCHIFDIKSTGSIQKNLKCSNGDGILIGKEEVVKNQDEKILTTYNKKKVKYLLTMIKTLRNHNINPILIFEPTPHNKFIYNIKEVQRLFSKTRIIDLTNYFIQDKYWSDHSHLTFNGRVQYSKYLVDIFLRTLNFNKKNRDNMLRIMDYNTKIKESLFQKRLKSEDIFAI